MGTAGKNGVAIMGLSGRILTAWLGVILLGGTALAFAAAPATEGAREVPEAFAPLEYLVSGWKGAGVPQANKLKGWEEIHSWAWKFQKGVPVGVTLTLQGNKTLAKALLTQDAATKKYTLTGEDPAKKPVSFVGGFEKDGKTLLLDRVGLTSVGAKQRITLKPNGNLVRYTMTVLEQEEGAPQFKPVFVTSLTKDGESFAAGNTAGTDGPKCIVTGGSATMTVSYQGKTFPLCCSGCRDEFNENPEKYVKKLALRMSTPGKPAAKTASSTNRDDSFDGLTDDAKPKAKAASKTAKAAMKDETPAAKDEPAPAKAGSSEAISKAASLLRLGQNLEKAGKTSAALGYYRQVVKSYATTPSAKLAAERIKALDEK
jgi:YHS domain-containing protein